jgi:mxaJ protein
MGSVLLSLAALAVAGGAVAELPELRVCADPDNLPFSHRDRQGFENKIAELVANDLGAALTYYWWPHQRGLVRNTLGLGRCDVLIGVPAAYDPVLGTAPYYRSAYALVYPRGRGFAIRSLDDPLLTRLTIGVYVNTPPDDALGERGIRANVVRYSLFYDYSGADAERRPGRLVEDVSAGVVDAAILWGPSAGYWRRKAAVPLELVLLEGSPTIPMAFDVSMGVRKGDKVLRARLEDVLERKRREIRNILEGYGVPVLEPTPSAAGQGGDRAGGHPHATPRE